MSGLLRTSHSLDTRHILGYGWRTSGQFAVAIEATPFMSRDRQQYCGDVGTLVNNFRYTGTRGPWPRRSGTGPFKNLKPNLLPGSLARLLNKLLPKPFGGGGGGAW